MFFCKTDGTFQDHRPRRPGLIIRQPGLLSQKKTRPSSAQEPFRAKIACFDTKILKEKESSHIVHVLNEGLPHLKFLLQSQEQQHNNGEFIYDLTCTLARACEAPSGEKTNKILAALKGSVFLTSKVPSLLHLVEASTSFNGQICLHRLIQSLIVVFMKYVNHLPSAYADLPYAQLKAALDQATIYEKEKLQKELGALKQARDEIIRSERQKHVKRYILNRPGEKPPNDFREIPICPTNKEITTQERPFLRKNISRGRYENAEHYLDVQFRLLREDFLEPLREGIHEIILNIPRKKRKHLMKNYRSVRIIGKEFTWSGIIHQVQIDVSRIDTSRWPKSKRLLFGSFLCLSKDNFKTILFATVSNRDENNLKKGRVDIRFIEEQNFGGIEIRNCIYQMVESPAYFEAYRHVLTGLKELGENSLPFKKYLVECSAEVDPPEYLRRDETEEPVCYNLSKALDIHGVTNASAVPVLQPEAWPPVKELPLNSSQLDALRTAITTEFSVIQGPPGTGKTYVGARIVACLLDNRPAWDPDGISPMLMVCYTNHGLDQFLEKVLDFLPKEEIIRVGGRCKSKDLEACNLKKFSYQHRLYDKRNEVREKMWENEGEIQTWKEKLSYADCHLLEYDDLEELLYPAHAQQLYNTIFPPNVAYESRTPRNIFRLWLCGNKIVGSCNRIANVPAHQKRNVEDVEVSYDTSLLYKPQDGYEDTKSTRDPSSGLDRLHEVSLKTKEVVFEREELKEISYECKLQGRSSVEQTHTVTMNKPFSNISSDTEVDSTENPSPKQEFCVTDGEATIAIEMEVDLIQDQRWMQGDEELQLPISKEKSEVFSQKRKPNEEADEVWTVVTTKKKGKSFPWMRTGESKVEQATGASGNSSERDKTKASKKKKKKINDEKIHITENISSLAEELKMTEMMSSEEAMTLDNIWNLSQQDRLRIYLFWVANYRERYRVEIHRGEQEYEQLCKELEAIRFEEEERVLRQATVVGMTTSGAARYHSVLQRIAPKIVVIEEAAEVMEAHIITSLSHNTKHTILIGDHKQLRPKATVYELAEKYDLEISLFERMVMNSMDCKRLSIQHRMRPEIAALTKRIYDHEISDHESVCHSPDISGVCHNLFFIDHSQMETRIEFLQSYSNDHEADFIVALCNYLLLQGYKGKQITVLTMYTGQLLNLQEKMPRRKFKEVKVCAVDNFQGEENDIILLSLVRSNTEGSIGFLGESNRVCVALSRARLGFYCIGNFNLLKSRSKLWKEICDDLKTKQVIGDNLQLICNRHKRVTSVKWARDIESCHLGGCTMPCGDRLDCGHSCDKLCHASDEYHKKGFCYKMCANSCPSNHKCQQLCHYPRNCRCKVSVLKTPSCGHEQLVECGKDPDKVKCQFTCEKILKCGHKCESKCGFVCTKPCVVSCKKTLLCGHEENLPCYKDPKFYYQCNSSCNKPLKCGHPCSKKCKETCQCNTEIERELPCNHKVRVLCPEKGVKILCKEKCSRTLACGHACPGICYEDCRWKKCNISISKDLLCGHQASVPCFQDPRTVFCYSPCPRLLDCRHNCSSICGVLCSEIRCTEFCQKKCKRGHSCKKRCHFPLPCDCVEEVISTIPTCGHSIRIPCYVDPETLKCEKPCERVRSCGHPCEEICGKRCETRPCKVPVTTSLLCNHEVTLACHKNTEEYICKKEVQVRLACGHKTRLECCVVKSGLEHVSCKKNVEKELGCKHKVTLPCFKNPEECICRKKVDVELSCGHKKTVQCYTATEGLDHVCCTVRVPQMLACNHEVTLPCNIKPEEYRCQEEIEITLSCGHNNRTTCADSRDERQREKCKTMVTKKLPCSHEKEMKCSDKPEDVSCDVPCERYLPCEHPCLNKCGEQCSSVKCSVKVTKNLSCGFHKVSCPCSKDVSQLICSNPCARTLQCGHQCPGKCSEDCSQYEYNCRQIVMKTLSCAGKHSLEMRCNEDPSKVVCQERCRRNLDCSHPCPGLCSQPCDSMICRRRVEKIHPCDHKEHLPCFQSKNATCKAPCQRRLKCKHKCKGLCGELCSKYLCHVVLSKSLSCGHKVKMPCSLSVNDVQCPVPCRTKLPCGHQCSGTCGDCKARGSHELCQNPCNRLLVCSHRCQATCCEPCTPCAKNCGRHCPHGRCSKKCSEPCNPCGRPCTWNCPHYECKNTCGEECNRPRCDAACPKKLPCGHACIGLCGENCPTVCATCHAKMFSSMIGRKTDQTESIGFLQLFDCGHIVKVEEMDAWMLRDWGSDVQLIHCPRCSTPITFSYRYGDIIKRTLTNTENVKKQTLKILNETARVAKGLVDKLNPFQFDIHMMRFPKDFLDAVQTAFQSVSLDTHQMPNMSLLCALKNHLLVIQQIKNEQYRLENMIKQTADSEALLDIQQQFDTIKDALAKISEYLQTPELELRTLNQVNEHTRKFALFGSILEAKSKALRHQINFSSSGQTRLEMAQEKFDSFVHGTNEALEVDWLERVAAEVRKEVSLTPPPKEEPKDFENFPGFNRGIWRVCEHRQVVFTKSLMRSGQSVTELQGRCKECVDLATKQEK